MSYILLVLLITGVVAASLGVASNAIWTDSQNVDANVFSTGSIDISTNPTTQLVTYTSPPMAPGDKVTSPITVTNAGSLQLRYAVTSTTTGDALLAAQLDMTIWDEAAEGDGGETCTSTPPGTKLYGPADLGATTPGINVIGNPAQGAQGGERTLAPSPAYEVLCFQVELPSGTANSFQSKTTTATFAFAAEQTANN
ncbi:MAG: CalY family protein [Dehalococcoidia bacterium]|nr:CalY family protein [Dehalococcoidia bacterium]